MRKRRVVGRIYEMKYSWKVHKDKNRHKNRIKRSGQARLVYVRDINRNVPTTWRGACGHREDKRNTSIILILPNTHYKFYIIISTLSPRFCEVSFDFIFHNRQRWELDCFTGRVETSFPSRWTLLPSAELLHYSQLLNLSLSSFPSLLSHYTLVFMLIKMCFPLMWPMRWTGH